MNTSAVRHDYILSRLRGEETQLPDPEDDELTNITLILDALEDLDLSQYLMELGRESLLEYIINIELVLRGARLMYLFEASTTELAHELIRRLTETLTQLSCLQMGNGYLVYRSSRTLEAIVATIPSPRAVLHNPFATVLGYSYTKNDYHIRPTVIINLRIDDKDELYSFMCPASEYTPQILEESVEKAREFTEALAPLGFVITARLIYDQV